jgi:hypothetical protein
MSRQNWATVCYSLALLIVLAIGIIHYTRDTLLPWFVPVLGVPWDQLPSGIKVLFVAYMRIAGAGQIGAAIALGIILFGPFRRGESWANWTLAAVGCVIAALTSYGIFKVQSATGTSQPWYNPLAALVLCIVGFALTPRR